MAMVTRTFELASDAAAELDRLAHQEQCEPADVLNRLLRLFAQEELSEEDFTPEQWAMILEGEAAADAGEIATQEEVEAFFRRFSI